MPAITIADLNNAKSDCDHIAAVATSPLLTATDRLGATKLTLAGAVDRIAAVGVRGAWATATSYALKDVVTSGGTAYICIVAHTSGATFAGDLATKWRVFQGVLSSDLSDASAAKGSALSGHTDIDGNVTTVRDELLRFGSVIRGGIVKLGTNSTTSVRDAVLVARAITGLTDCHAFRDESTIRSVTDYGGYGVFDAKTNLQGPHLHNHIFSFQDRTVYTADTGGKLQNQVGVYSEPEFYGAAGSVDVRHGLRVKEHIGASGIVTIQAGVVIEALTKAGKNYGVVVQGTSMLNVFGGRALFGDVLDPATNEGVAFYGTGLTGSNTAGYQSAGVGLGQVGGWTWAAYSATPVVNAAAQNGSTLYGTLVNDAIVGGSVTVAAQVGHEVKNLTKGASVFALISRIVAGVNRWGLYLIGGAQNLIGGKSYFGGTTEVAPTATIHVAAGGTAAGSAPIKLTAGPLLTTPEHGALEFDGNHVYFTIGSVRKQLDN